MFREHYVLCSAKTTTCSTAIAISTMARKAGISVVPSLSSLSSLLARVSQQYESALQAQSIYFYPSKVTVIEQQHNHLPTSTGQQQSNTQTSKPPPSVAFTIRCVPALLDKAKEKHQKSSENASRQNQGSSSSDVNQQNPQDVFAPPYHPDLVVEELPQHTILLNKFCVVPKHFLLVTRDFQPQTMPPAPEMLAIAYRILLSHHRSSSVTDTTQSSSSSSRRELLAFYNCGQVSGASQPHQHVQFAELGGEGESGNDSVPIERLLERVPTDGKEDDVFALPLPYQHFVSLIKQPPTQDDAAALQDYLGRKLLSLLDALFQARITQATSDITAASKEGQPTAQRRAPPPSWNLLMTTRAMHLVPRQREEFDGLQEMVKSEGVSHVEDGVDLVGSLSVNALGYAGHLLVKSNAELDYLQKYPGGVLEVLKQTGALPVRDVTAEAP